MGIAQMSQQVTVTDETTQIETTQSATTASIRQTEVAELPMINRSLAAEMTLLPGVREVPQGGLAGNAPTHGQSGSYVSFGGNSGRDYDMLVDGMDNKEDHDGATTMVYSLE